jgi:dienelactone hydrolase
MAISPRIEIHPRSALVDERVTIRLSGLPPNKRVTVRASTRDDDLNRLWKSFAVYKVDIHGKVDLTWRRALEGSFQGIDGMGLFWSMELDPSAEEECYFRKTSLDPINVQISVEMDGEIILEGTAVRNFIAKDIIRREVRMNGLVGVLFVPNGDGPYPGVIVLGGDDGGIHEHGAALLASRGYAALALGYFNMPGLPDEPVEVPLEYFQRAVRWLQDRSFAEKQFMAILGTSLGSVYALLAASKFPAINATAIYAPISVVLGRGLENNSPATFRGVALPSLPLPEPTLEEARYYEQMTQQHKPVSYNSLHLRALENDALAQQSVIQAERMSGPLLLFTGQEDGAHPSEVYARQIMDRLEAMEFSYEHRHICYPGAGHTFGLPQAHGLPYIPTYSCVSSNSRGPQIDYGGNMAANARANSDSWKELLRFLARSRKSATK